MLLSNIRANTKGESREEGERGPEGENEKLEEGDINEGRLEK